MALPKQHRLGSSREFNRVHRQGLRASTHHLAMRALSPRRSGKKHPPKLKLKSHESAERNPSALLHRQQTTRRAATAQGLPSSVTAPSQFGISISKKVSKRAVVRNRIKRQIKAVIHQYLPAIAPGWKVVIVVRPSAVECEFADFLRELEYLLRKLRLYRDHT